MAIIANRSHRNGPILSDEDQTKFSGRRTEPQQAGPAAAASSDEGRAVRRTRRRERARRGLDTSVPSPCISVCQIDPKNDLCIGCLRHIDEIRDWLILSAEQKRAILAKLPGRRS